MRRLTILFAGMFLVTTLTLLGVQSATYAQSASPSPTRTPTATRTTVPLPVNLIVDRTYYHSTGLFSIPRIVGWEPRPLYDAVRLPTISADSAAIYVDFINDPVASTVRVGLEKLAAQQVTTVQDIGRFITPDYLQGDFSGYKRGWEETGRTVSGNQYIVTFNLHDTVNTVNYDYVGKLIARLDHGWIVYLQLTVPTYNARLEDRLQQILWPGLTFYPAEAAVPLQWATLSDSQLGYMLKIPFQWYVSGHEGGEFFVDGSVGNSYVSLSTGTDSRRRIQTQQDARDWIRSFQPDAKILTVKPETIKGAKGFSVSYTSGSNAATPRGRISFRNIQAQRSQSAVATLYMGDNGTLYWMLAFSSITNIDLLDPNAKGVPPQFAQIRGTFMLLPANAYVAVASSQVTPTVTVQPSATINPDAFDMTSARKYQSPSGLFEMQLPTDWDAQSTGSTARFELGRSASVYLALQIDQPEVLYGTLFNSGRKSFDSPQAALQAYRNQRSVPSLTYGTVHAAKIGTYDGYALGLTATISQNNSLVGEIRIALLPNGQAIEAVMAAQNDISAKAQPVLNAMLNSLILHLPETGPTSTPQPILLTATSIQRQVHELTETSTPTMTPSPTITPTPSATWTSTPTATETFTPSATVTPVPSMMPSQKAF